MTEKDAQKISKQHLAKMLEVEPCTPFFMYGTEKHAMEKTCYWFTFKFSDELRIGASRVIGISKQDGTVAFVGEDDSE